MVQCMGSSPGIVSSKPGRGGVALEVVCELLEVVCGNVVVGLLIY